MDPLYDLIESVRTMPLWQAAVWVMLANLMMFLVALGAGELIRRRFRERQIADAGPFTGMEIKLAAVCVVLNGLLAVAGVALWRDGPLDLRLYGDYSVLTVLIDTLVLFIAMDFAMYVFHRVAHHPLLFPLAHSTHHLYENPRPLTLFVLNPVEVLGFGILWLLVVIAYSAAIEAVLAYLTINLVFGLIGHLGVEPAPAAWVKLPLLRYISTSTFHAEHHADRNHNYGFYLLVWDRLFGTLSPEYAADFARSASARPAASSATT